jgi:hypothetical protein
MEGRNENYKKYKKKRQESVSEKNGKRKQIHTTCKDTCEERMELLCQERVYNQRSMMNMFLCTGTVRQHLAVPMSVSISHATRDMGR